MMTYYVDKKNNEIYAYDDTQTPKSGLVKITEKEKDDILAIKERQARLLNQTKEK